MRGGRLFGVLICLVLGVSGAFAQDVTVSVTPQAGSTLTIGSAYGWEVRTTNNSPSALNIGPRYFVIFPDGTRVQVAPRPRTRDINSGSSLGLFGATTTSILSDQTGTFTFEAEAVDVDGNVLATGAAAFTILPLPSSLIPPRFTDIAAAAGVGAIHNFDQTDCMNAIGTGAGWADYDGDGLLDLFVSDYGVGTSHLYRNNGDLTFAETTAAAGIPDIVHATGVSWADYDNDGDPDLLVLTYGSPALLENNGDGTFSDVSASSGLGVSFGRGTTSAWGDYDSDGWVDLYVVNRDDCEPTTTPDRLFRNEGNGTFTDVTDLMGGVSNPALLGLGFAATWFDYNNDNRPDLYVVNDRGGIIYPNVLWRNDGPDGLGGWLFTDVSDSSGADFRMAAMGVGVGDYNRDGWMDMAVSNIAPNRLARNNGDGTFTNVAQSTGAERIGVQDGLTSVTWGIGFVDLNNDGYEDIVIAAGDIPDRSIGAQLNAVLVNNVNNHLTGVSNDGVFLDLTYASNATDLEVSRTLAVADFDADGWMDAIFINHFDDPPHLYRNEGPVDGNTNHWLQVRLVGTTSNRDGIGAKLTLVAGGETQYRQIISGTSLGGGSQVAAHFGLAANTQVDSLEILWPSGSVQTFTGLAGDQRLVITEGSDVLGNDPTPARTPSPAP